MKGLFTAMTALFLLQTPNAVARDFAFFCKIGIVPAGYLTIEQGPLVQDKFFKVSDQKTITEYKWTGSEEILTTEEVLLRLEKIENTAETKNPVNNIELLKGTKKKFLAFDSKKLPSLFDIWSVLVNVFSKGQELIFTSNTFTYVEKTMLEIDGPGGIVVTGTQKNISGEKSGFAQVLNCPSDPRLAGEE